MARQPRPQIPGGYYHVIARGVAASPIVLDDDDRATFIHLLMRAAARGSWHIHAYCLMTTHVHLVVETPLPNLSRGLQWLFSVHAQQFNERWGRFGHLFADRFSSRVIKEDDYFEDVCRYVFENPVKAGLCARASEWRWSGGRIFAALTQAPVGL